MRDHCRVSDMSDIALAMHKFNLSIIVIIHISSLAVWYTCMHFAAAVGIDPKQGGIWRNI